MLNMAPDKAADETISFQCYPLRAALLYTGRPALTAVLLSYALPLSLSLVSSHPYSSSSLFTPLLVLALLSTFPPLHPKIYLPHHSPSLLYLHSVLVSSRYPVHVQSEIRRKDRDKELLIFFDIAMFISNDAPGFLICVIGQREWRLTFRCHAASYL